MSQWRILVIDDQEDVRESTREFLERSAVSTTGEEASVHAVADFDEGLALLSQGDFDLVILDIRDQRLVTGEDEENDGDDATAADVGLDVYRQVRERRFIPIVFQTAVAGLAAELENRPFVSVVSKDESVDVLLATVREAFDSSLPTIHRALLDHVVSTEHAFMAEFVERHWNDLSDRRRKGDLAHLLARRLGLSLSSGAFALGAALGDSEDVELEGDDVHPMRYYVIPAVPAEGMGGLCTGDLLRGDRLMPSEEEQDDVAWYVVLTPACDIARGKAEFVVLAEAVPIARFAEYSTWIAAEQDRLQVLADAESDDVEKKAEYVRRAKAVEGAQKKIQRLLGNNREGQGQQPERWHYLPFAWDVPDLVVDFQRIVHARTDIAVGFSRVATLDSPYAEAVIARFTRYLGRVGTPDLDLSVPLARMLVPE